MCILSQKRERCKGNFWDPQTNSSDAKLDYNSSNDQRRQEVTLWIDGDAEKM